MSSPFQCRLLSLETHLESRSEFSRRFLQQTPHGGVIVDVAQEVEEDALVELMIRISGEEWGCITTEQEYENYKLLIEFKWGELTYEPRMDRARDSGVLLHSQGEDGQKETIKEGRVHNFTNLCRAEY